ncbi:TetR/AcrR family transcriptional regulator [Allorhizocola rhizosphaerae]|uniref:TetR/AcrR family transcriptional regulator n=1 Tax=Allorhizocola rhizosphaerae TaxID=1872709 RepID=UPI000E3BABE2|nr:TetR/AcrR family transcriptional regulator [Allorhizocola rhizosphaerae]
MARPSGTKKRIQAVAQELFLAQGVRNTSLRQISDRLGITKPALYYHFASRDELVKSIIQPLIDDTEAFMSGREPGDPRRLLEDYFDLLWRHREVFIMLLRDPSTLAYLNLTDRVFRWRRTLTGLLVGPEPSSRALIHATVALGGMSDCAVEHSDAPFEEVKAAAVEAAAAALAVNP